MTLVSKNVCIDKLAVIVNNYNNRYHSTIKMKPADVKSNTYIDSCEKIMKKISNLKLVLLVVYEKMKIFFDKFTLQIGLTKFL